MNGIAPHLRRRLLRHIEEVSGIELAEEHHHPDFTALLQAMGSEFGIENPTACVEWLLHSPPESRQCKRLIDQITIGETHFFRDPEQLNVVSAELLPDLLQRCTMAGRRPRIWHPGCASGEEPYTMAMLLAPLLPASWRREGIILGTDINTDALAKAVRGRYTAWSFRNSTPAWAHHHFRPTAAGESELSPAIRKMVRFSYLNLANDADYPSPANGTAELDLICCRNVLMYFSRRQIQRVLGRFHLALADGGCLLLTPCEQPLIKDSPFTPVNVNGVTLFYKASPEGHRRQDRPAELSLRPAGAVRGKDKRPIEKKRPSQKTKTSPAPPARLPEAPAPATAPATARYQTALNEYARGRYAEAAALLEPLLELHQAAGPVAADQAAATMLLTRVYANQGKIDLALAWCEKCLAANRLDPAAYLLAAVVHQENGDLEGAIRLLRQALFLDQNFILAHYLLGNHLLHLHREATARRHFATAASLLQTLPAEELLPEADGITAGHLRVIIASLLPDSGHRLQGEGS